MFRKWQLDIIGNQPDFSGTANRTYGLKWKKNKNKQTTQKIPQKKKNQKPKPRTKKIPPTQ